jgi:hypothetical protein
MKRSSFIACAVFALTIVSSAVPAQARPSKASGAAAVSAAASLADGHKAQGVGCADCHGKDQDALVPNRTCFGCHESFEKLAGRTKDMKINPHRSPHFMDLECTSCHVGHKADVNFCQDCHGPITRKK